MEGFQGKLDSARGNPSTTITSSFYCRRLTETLKFANIPRPIRVRLFRPSNVLAVFPRASAPCSGASVLAATPRFFCLAKSSLNGTLRKPQ